MNIQSATLLPLSSIKQEISSDEECTPLPLNPDYFHVPASSSSEQLVYRRGEHVYIDISPTMPYEIGQILDIKQYRKSVKVTVNLLVRRQDVPKEVVRGAEDEYIIPLDDPAVNFHELYLSDETKEIPSSKLRGKCTVFRLSVVESPKLIDRQKDVFFYRLQYSNEQLTSLNFTSVRVGPEYQAVVPATTIDCLSDDRRLEDLETAVYSPHHNYTDSLFDQYFNVARSFCLFGRAKAHNEHSEMTPPPVPECLDLSNQGVIMEFALNRLHESQHNFEVAVNSFMPDNLPVLGENDLGLWTSLNKDLFDEAYTAYGNKKNRFQLICDHICACSSCPKTVKEIIFYYYAWKKTDRGKAVYDKVKTRRTMRKVTETVHIAERPSTGSASESGVKCESCQHLSLCHDFTCRLVSYKLCAQCHHYWQRMDCLNICN